MACEPAALVAAHDLAAPLRALHLLRHENGGDVAANVLATPRPARARPSLHAMTQGRTPDRFVVRSITGYSASQSLDAATSYWILDLDYAQVVATYYSGPGGWGNGELARRLRAEARCRYLNEQYRRWLHTGRPMDVEVVSC